MNKKKIIWITVVITLVIIALVIWKICVVMKENATKERETKIEKLELANNERCDGQVIFTLPEGFECREKEMDLVIDEVRYFLITNEEYLYYGVVDSYNDTDKSPEVFNYYWNGWMNERAQKNHLELMDEGVRTINGRECHYRIGEYFDDDKDVFMRMYMLYDDKTGNACMMMFCDNNSSTEYVDEMLESVRFIGE